MTTQTYRRARHSASTLHAHLVFVTTYRLAGVRRRNATFAENTMRAMCSELDTELVEFNGDTDYVNPLMQDRMHGHLWSPSYFAVPGGGAPAHHQAIYRRPNPTTLTAGLRPPTDAMG